MSIKKVLVTGAPGQIGNAVYMRLKEQPDRYDAYALDRTVAFSERVPKSWVHDIPQTKFHQCDLTDLDGLRDAVRGMDVGSSLPVVSRWGTATVRSNPTGRSSRSAIRMSPRTAPR